MAKWEYKMLDVSVEEISFRMNELGKEGWHLVSALMPHPNLFVLFFKRELRRHEK